MISKKLRSVVRDIPDFPKEGIIFKDITPVLLDHELCAEVADAFVKELDSIKVDAVLAIESRGFLFGMLIAQKLQVPFIPIRKKGKLPGDTFIQAYNLEYGSAEIEMHKEDLPVGSRILIHDDLLATGGTAAATAELAKMQDAEVAAFSFLIKLDDLKGSEKIKRYSRKIISLVNY